MRRYSIPMRCDFDTDEDYQAAMEAYEYEEDIYMDEYIERQRGYDY